MSAAISPEWLQATATGIVVLLAGWWILRVQGGLWRRFVWREAGARIDETARALGAPVRARWAGYSVRTRGVRVSWRGSLAGPSTVVRRGRRRVHLAGLAGADAVMAVLDDHASS